MKHRIRIIQSLSWSFNPRLTRFWILSVVVWATVDQVWKTISRVLINCNWCFETPYSDNRRSNPYFDLSIHGWPGFESSVWLFEPRLIKFEKTISRVLINCNWCFETPYSDNQIPILIFQSTFDQVWKPQGGCLSHGWSNLKNTISRVLINCNGCSETPYSDNLISILIFQSTVEQVWKTVWTETRITVMCVLKHRSVIPVSISAFKH